MPSEYFNPADHLLDLVSIDSRRDRHDASVERVWGLVSTWRSYDGKIDVEEEDNVADEVQPGQGKERGVVKTRRTTGMLVALPVVLERHWKNLWRQKDVSLAIAIRDRDPLM
jgi:hypothetical protein